MRAHEQGDELTLTQAAAAAGVSRSTVRRMLDRGQLEGAHQDEQGTWLVPVSALVSAGLELRAPGAEQGQDTPGERGAQPGSALSVLSELAPLLQQLTNLQRERGELESELRVAQFRLAQVAETESRPSRAGSGLLLAGGALVTAAGAWALAPELHLLGAGVTAAAGVLAAGWAWVTR